ncbi:MAG TPA: flagellar hook protein FlgE [Planctomycetota bacterium]|nr:flagellar hook protein FlgE [Planctomycetota bacterium]
MALSSSLFAGLTGLAAHQSRMDVIGDNISNVNTTGYKAGRVLFETAFARTMGIGSSPSGELAGVNPQQVGLGVGVASITRDFAQGAIETTGVNTDLAIEGQGFFILSDETGGHVYSRDGSFTVNPELYLTSSAGYFVQGFNADENFQIVPSGTVERIRIPVGQLTIAKETENADFTGNLNGSGDEATRGSHLLGNEFVDTVGVAATGTTLLTDLRLAGALGTQLFAVDDVLTMDCQKSSRDLPEATYTVTATSQFGTHFAPWLEDVLGINTSVGVPLSPGISINGSGQLDIYGNGGESNALNQLQISTSASASTPFTFTKLAEADGESFSSPFTAYDSLGSPLVVHMTFVMETKATTGNTWRWYAEAEDDTDEDLAVGTGTVTFATDGTYVSDSGAYITIDVVDTGAETPVLISPNFVPMTQLSDQQSGVALTFQDGAPQGTLTDFEVGQDGVVIGIFNNGQLRNLAQVAVANFTNRNGMFSAGGNAFRMGPNSGAPMITTPGQLGSGKIVSSALELSNVDLANEFVNLIVTSAGFSANSRVITTSEKMLEELLQIAR